MRHHITPVLGFTFFGGRGFRSGKGRGTSWRDVIFFLGGEALEGERGGTVVKKGKGPVFLHFGGV